MSNDQSAADKANASTAAPRDPDRQQRQLLETDLRSDPQNEPENQPMFNAPAAVVAALAVLIGLHVVRQWLSERADEWLVLALAFIPARYAETGAGLPGGGIAKVTSFFTHMLLHADAAHLLINGAWLLVFGTVIAKRTGTLRFFGLIAVTGAAGAAAFWAVNRGLPVPMVGASGAVSGLTGAFARFFFSAVDMGGGGLLRENPAAIPRASLSALFRDRRALIMLGMLVCTNLLFGLGLGTLITPGGIAWEAHLGGLAAGLLLFGWFDREQLLPVEHSPEPAAGHDDPVH